MTDLETAMLELADDLDAEAEDVRESANSPGGFVGDGFDAAAKADAADRIRERIAEVADD